MRSAQSQSSTPSVSSGRKQCLMFVWLNTDRSRAQTVWKVGHILSSILVSAGWLMLWCSGLSSCRKFLKLPRTSALPSCWPDETADRLTKAAATPSTSPLHLIQRSQDPSETEAEISLETKKNNGYDPQKDQIHTLDRRTQTTIFRLRTGHCGLRKTSEEIRSCWFSPLWMWLWGANPWAHFSDLPTPGDSTPTVLARRHWSGHQALGASCGRRTS